MLVKHIVYLISLFGFGWMGYIFGWNEAIYFSPLNYGGLIEVIGKYIFTDWDTNFARRTGISCMLRGFVIGFLCCLVINYVTE